MSTVDSESRRPLLSVRNLTTSFSTEFGVVDAVRGVSWDIYPGEVLGVVGESGSGKSVTMGAVMGLVPSPPGIVRGDEILFEGRDLLTLPAKEMRAIRGREIAMIFQDPMTSFNPVRTIGHQIAEAIRVHEKVSKKAARTRVIELLRLVGVPSPETRYGQYPHEYSGGMRQRAMIAMAIVNRPKLLIADEPTTALDVTIQAQILDVLTSIREETDAAMVLITHDLGLIAEMADRVMVMYGGKAVETADVRALFSSPSNPYTAGLLESLPRIDAEVTSISSIPGQPPSLASPPSGCYFHPRCEVSGGRSVCRTDEPPLRVFGVDESHLSACHFAEEVADPAYLETGVVVR